ncbi:MAG: glycosyltransferase [Candidatus Lokiarchaeota archaeon]|nr:glycosyltransferase [Candidatus Lokiarchaeota archaeon]MBD3200824.1 glycosyltransferase [Candidatus Lokiarchaeota archaeon]
MRLEMVEVSILLPVYNRSQYIEKTLDSIINQTFRDFEIIVIDDGSKDDCPSIIKRYAQKEKRIHDYYHSENKGIALTRNELIQKANGRYIAFIDSDDLWEPVKLERQISVLKEKENLVVWSEGLLIDEFDKDLDETFTRSLKATNKKKSGDLFNVLLKGNYILFSSILFKAKLIENFEFDHRYRLIDDYQLIIYLASRCNFYFIDDPLVKYRTHGKNIIKSNFKILIHDVFRIYVNFYYKYNNSINQNMKWVINLIIIEISAFFKQYRISWMYIPKFFTARLFNPLNFKVLILIYLKSNSLVNKVISNLKNNDKYFSKIIIYYYNLFLYHLSLSKKLHINQIKNQFDSKNLALLLGLYNIKINKKSLRSH